MLMRIVILIFLPKKYESNPVSVAFNTAKSGARMAGKILNNKAVRRIKSGSEHISAAINNKENAGNIFEELKKLFQGKN